MHDFLNGGIGGEIDELASGTTQKGQKETPPPMETWYMIETALQTTECEHSFFPWRKKNETGSLPHTIHRK